MQSQLMYRLTRDVIGNTDSTEVLQMQGRLVLIISL